jgi:hypothetical protein
MTNKLPMPRIQSAQPTRPITAQPVKFATIDEEEDKRRKLLYFEDIQKKKNKERYEDKLIDIAINKVNHLSQDHFPTHPIIPDCKKLKFRFKTRKPTNT